MIYFGTRLSENISRREPEGYLICLNVPVARTGTQEYLPSELGLSGPDSRLIPVFRPEEEVFSPACIASFEGMPVTDDHPSAPEGVTSENIRRLQKGHAHHIRRGGGDESDLLLADLIVTDPALIEEILHGKREISCGYNYTLCEEDGHFIQREIRGNHVAVVDAGRAGPRVSIRDQEPSGKTEPQPASGSVPDPGFQGITEPNLKKSHDERSSLMKKKSLWRAKMMARMAKDGDVEELAEIISEVMGEPESVPAVPVPAADPVVSAVVSAVAENIAEEGTAPAAPVAVEAPAGQPVIVDCGPEILAALHQIIQLLSASADCSSAKQDCGSASSDDGDPADEAEEAAEAAAAAAEAVSAAEELAENVAQAAAEAAEALEETVSDPEALPDPVEELVAEILEGSEPDRPEEDADASGPEDEIISGILEPEDASDEDPDPDCRAADALRAALASFRPRLQRLSPEERQRFNADVAARMKQLTRRNPENGRPNAYQALRKAAAHDQSGRSLGRKIMESRNANLRK